MTTVERQGARGIALFSEDERYRYALRREWDPRLPSMAWVLLNPSTADADQDDPTIRRCIGFAKGWGYGGLTILNLFALRSTDPRALYAAGVEAIGELNDAVLRQETRDVPLIVCGWGAHGAYLSRGLAVRAALAERSLYCLGLTNGGQPKHPLYLASSSALAELLS